jgi:hypothetical protein
MDSLKFQGVAMTRTRTANVADFASLLKQGLTLLPFVTVSFVSGAKVYRSRRAMLLLRCTGPEVTDAVEKRF